MIEFNKHNVTNGKEKVRVSYGLDNGNDTRKCVTILSKDLGNDLCRIFEGQDGSMCWLGLNGKRKTTLFESHPLYAQARLSIENRIRRMT